MSELMKAAPGAAGAIVPALFLSGVGAVLRVGIVVAGAAVAYFVAEPASNLFGNGSPKISGVIIGVFLVPVFRKLIATIEAVDLSWIIMSVLRKLAGVKEEEAKK